jgi:hypothetical protein
VIYVLNAPVITNFGSYSFIRILPEEAKTLLAGGFVSAIGHAGTALVMSDIIGTEIPYNRVPVHMLPGDKAVVLWLLDRPSEGHVYSAEELDNIPRELGLLERIS